MMIRAKVKEKQVIKKHIRKRLKKVFIVIISKKPVKNEKNRSIITGDRTTKREENILPNIISYLLIGEEMVSLSIPNSISTAKNRPLTIDGKIADNTTTVVISHKIVSKDNEEYIKMLKTTNSNGVAKETTNVALCFNNLFRSL